MSEEQVATAQVAYANMLRAEVAPRLRALGFRGSRSTYVLPDADRWLIVGLQKSYYSRADCVEFTVNLTVSDKRIWAVFRDRYDWFPARPSGNDEYVPGSVHRIRLGNLMPPDGKDRWWKVDSRRPSAPVARRVLKAIEGLGLPWLRTGASRWPEMTQR